MKTLRHATMTDAWQGMSVYDSSSLSKSAQCGAQTSHRKVQMPSIADALEELNDKAMTRKEQIKEYLQTIGAGETMGIPFDAGFECGVEWADIHPHWKSVEDELPKEDGQYLGCVKGKTQDIVSYLSGRWLLCNRFDMTKVITHWMLLPSPPKKGDREND